jgi:hypothetical protein
MQILMYSIWASVSVLVVCVFIVSMSLRSEGRK